MKKGIGSGVGSGSGGGYKSQLVRDPYPHQNVTDPQHYFTVFIVEVPNGQRTV
jgi:hypothetical protein